MMPEMVGAAPSVVIVLIATIIGNSVPSSRMPAALDIAPALGGARLEQHRGEIRVQRIPEILRNDRRRRPADDLARRPTEHRLGGRVEGRDREVVADRQDPFRGILDDGAMVGLVSLRLVFGARRLQRLLREQRVGALLALPDRARHPDRDAEHERTEEPDGLAVRAVQERRHPAFEHEGLTDRTSGQRPPEHCAPRRRARTLEVGQCGEGERHAEGRAPAAHVDGRGDRGDVGDDAGVEPQRPERRAGPPFRHRTQQLRADDRADVRPDRHVRDQREVPHHQQEDERHRPDGVRQHHRREATRRVRAGVSDLRRTALRHPLEWDRRLREAP